MSASLTLVDPLDVPLPADIHMGVYCFRQGSSLRAFVQEMQAWKLRVHQRDLLAQAVAARPDESQQTKHQQALHEAGLSAYHEGLACDPPGHFDAEEQREWALGWIDGIKGVWSAP